jgi:hypothetical protein
MGFYFLFAAVFWGYFGGAFGGGGLLQQWLLSRHR